LKAIVYNGPRNFVVEERPDPHPERGQVLIRPLVVGLCFSDKQGYEGSGANGALRAPAGVIGGHEIAGEIVELGAGVEGLEVGQRVSVDPRVYCGECLPCRAGVETLCSVGRKTVGWDPGFDGGLAELCVVPSYACFPLGDNVSMEAGACVEPMTCATRSIRHCGLRIGDNVVLLGGEDYNLFGAKWLRSAGASQVVLVDPAEHRREAALSMGAHQALGTGDGLVARIRESMPIGPDIVMVAIEDYVAESDPG
jgi:threonine dehydrogenase-like Zn-dependent dehydrogenase